MKQFISIMLLLALFVSCGKNSMNEEQGSSADSTMIRPMDKEDVKAFWEAYREAQKMRTEGHWEKAIIGYKKAVDIDSLHQDSWFNMGNMYLELHQYKEAERCWEKVVFFNDNSAKAHMQLGRLYMSFDRPEMMNSPIGTRPVWIARLISGCLNRESPGSIVVC